jgi:hypothetical protein
VNVSPVQQENELIVEDLGIIPIPPQPEETAPADTSAPVSIKMEKIGLDGAKSQLTYNSLTKEVTIVSNGSENTKQVLSPNESNLRRILDSSGLFDAESSYPPVVNATNYGTYKITASLGVDLASVAWTTASEVPDKIANLPFILASTLEAGRPF